MAVEHKATPIAIVGMSALFPGSADVPGFWRNVLEGRDLMTDVPQTHWLLEDYYDTDPNAADKTYGRRGAFLSPIDFDTMEFGIAPNNLPATDTSQLLALIAAERLLHDITGGELDGLDRGRVSVIVGSSTLELQIELGSRLQRPIWLKALRESGVDEPRAQAICDRIASHYVPWQEASFPGLLSNVVAGRIANRFDLHGTNCITDAACASSLAAISMGINELAVGQADLVITGGVDTLNGILMYMCFSKTPALSPTGDCRPFSDQADGTMLGEGLALFGLRRLEDAERDHNRVYAVLRGLGAASDGQGTSVYAPLPDGQATALRRAYESAGYGPETVELVEAHGTGTKAGDAAEFAALRAVFDDSGRADREWCALGSVKSQIGHTKSAAGAAGLLKAALALHEKALPPTIKVERPNPTFDLPSSPFYLSTETRPWIRDQAHPRRASVSSFGFGGTNFHLTLEEYQGNRRAGRVRAAPSELVLLAAASPAKLMAESRQLLDDACPLAATARASALEFDPHANARLAIVATDRDDLAKQLTQAIDALRADPEQPFETPRGATYRPVPVAPGGIAFLFSGQGSQRVGMGAEVAIEFEEARAAWDEAASLKFDGAAVHEVVFPVPVFGAEERASQHERLTRTEWAQPALAVQSLALLRVLSSCGVDPDCAAGHSFGELVALHLAGAFDSETLVRLARRRGELMRDASATRGAMLAVQQSRERVESLLGSHASDDLGIANHNAPRQVVVGGALSAIEAFERTLSDLGVAAQRLSVATAFHSPLVAGARRPLREFLAELAVGALTLPVYGNRDAAPYPTGAEALRDRVADQMVSPVRFVDLIESMWAAGARTFIEIGAGATLSNLVREILGDREALAVSLDRKGKHGVTALQTALGRLAVHGVEIDFAPLWHGVAAERTVSAPRTTTPILGANYGRPYPPPEVAAGLPDPVELTPAASAPAPMSPPLPTTPPAAPMSPPPAAAAPPAPMPPPVPVEPFDDAQLAATPGWIAAFLESQRQTAEAHAAYQRAMADSHIAFLQMAEGSLASFAALAGDGTAAAARALPAAQAVDWNSRVEDSVQVPAHSTPPGISPEPLLAEVVETPATPTPAATPAEVDLESVVLQVVAEATGYPVEMLSPEMDVAADLGIDSVKRVQILSTLRNRVPGLPEVDPGELGKLSTIGEIAAALGIDGQAEPDTHGGVRAEPASANVRDQPTASVRRWVVRALPRDPPGTPFVQSGDSLAVVDGASGIGKEVVDALRRRKVQARFGTTSAPTSGAVYLGGLREPRSVAEALAANREAFQLAHELAGHMQSHGGAFVTVQDTGGSFGLSRPDAVRAWLGGLAGLARTAAREWPLARVKAIDCERGGRDPATIAEAIADELTLGGGATDVGLDAGGARIILETIPEPVQAAPQQSAVAPPSVILATGGARGVTAASMLALAQAHAPRIVLVGRTRLDPEPESLEEAADEAALKEALFDLARRDGSSPTPRQIGERARAVLAQREVRATLDALRAAGSEVRYVSCDVQDEAALRTALAEVRAQWGPITGIVHAAGILADKPIGEKTDGQFAAVFDTKVLGLRTVLAATAEDPLRLLCMFSSITARIGNQGQSDYAMANEVLNQVASAERARRPDCLVRAICWGPWNGGMVNAALAEHFRRQGVPLMPVAAAARAFVEELEGSTEEVQVVLGAAGEPLPLSQASLFEVVLDEHSHPYLADHCVAGAPVVPMALALEWFAQAADHDGPLALREVEVVRGIQLLDGAMRLGIAGSGERLELRAADGTLQYRAIAGRIERPQLANVTAPSALAPLDRVLYDGHVLFHGPRFQAIRVFGGRADGGAVSELIGTAALGWPGKEWKTDPAALDGCLQTAVVWAEGVLGGASLPMAIAECRVHRPGLGRPPLRCVVRAGAARQLEATCDIALLDGDGGVRAELLGVTVVLRPDGPGRQRGRRSSQPES